MQGHRGDPEAYDRYLSAMDGSMRQKVALTAAHLLCEGRVADMGMGSGAGSHALAALYPGLEVIGVDLDPTMVRLARERHVLPNLRFTEGDIAGAVFPPESLDGIFDSSVLHHVTSFGGYDRAAAARAVEAQVAQLREHGVLVVRDFVDPGPGEVLLDLPYTDGDDGDDPRTCSTAALFERFSREFRSLSPSPGFEMTCVTDAPDVPEGFRRYRVSHTHAAEMILRKDYRADWEAEVKEEYTYMTQPELEALFARLGLRVLASTPLLNPWIVANRWRGRFFLRDLENNPLEPPPTNYVIAGEKVPAGEGVRFRDDGDAPPLGFLVMEHYRDRRTGGLRDLVRRPNATVDVLPWFDASGAIYVLARMSYPRPIVSTTLRDPPIDGSTPASYVTEPLSVIQTDRPLGRTVEDALASRAGISAALLRVFARGSVYYPSPGGVMEEVRSVFVQTDPIFVMHPLENRSGFSTSGRVRAIEARQLLRAAQVGGLADARLELNVYELLARLGRDPGPWIGETIALRGAHAPRRRTTLDDLHARPPRRVFERASDDSSAGFLEVRCRTFAEHDASSAVVASRELELVVPRSFGTNTVACALLCRHAGEVWLAVDDDDLPAAQGFDGHSSILVAPAWRLPRDVRSRTAARAFVRERLRDEYDAEAGEIWELGGPYHPSPGVTPESVHPLAIEVVGEGAGRRALAWIPLRSVVPEVSRLGDGHLRIVALRAVHALGSGRG